MITPWLTATSSGGWSNIEVDFYTMANPHQGWNGTACFNISPSAIYHGLIVDSYEYQRYQTGASPFWTPLRYPGQYYDAETDLSENWNRYFDAQLGRYLQPEPVMSRRPSYYGRVARAYGTQPNPYAYALNNPLHFVDRNGRCPGQIFPNIRAAGIDAINSTYFLSQVTGDEIGGLICELPDGQAYALSPAFGSATTVDVNVSGMCAGGKPNASYHAHLTPLPMDPHLGPFDDDDVSSSESSTWLGQGDNWWYPEIWYFFPQQPNAGAHQVQ